MCERATLQGQRNILTDSSGQIMSEGDVGLSAN